MQDEFAARIEYFLNEAPCDEVTNRLKPFNSFIADDCSILGKLNNKINMNFLIDVVKLFVNQARHNVEFTVAYSRKFFIIATLNHLIHDRIRQALPYIEKIKNCANSANILEGINTIYMYYINAHYNEIISSISDIALLIHLTHQINHIGVKLFSSIVKRFDVNTFIHLSSELEKLNINFDDYEKKEIIDNFATNNEAYHVNIWHYFLQFIEKLFDVYGFNLQHWVFYTESLTAVHKLIRVILVRCEMAPNSIKNYEMFSMLLNFPGVVDHHRDVLKHCFDELICDVFFNKPMFKFYRSRYVKLLIESGFFNINQVCVVKCSSLKCDVGKKSRLENGEPFGRDDF